MTTKIRFGRREALAGIGGLAIGGLVGVPALVVGQRATAPEGSPQVASRPPWSGLAPPGDDVRALFGPLRESSAISTHWRLEALHAPRAGAIPVVMSTLNGTRFAVEIFRYDPDGPRPIARAGDLALYLVNRGDGSSRTVEVFGLGVMALGRALEERLAAGAPIPNGLWTYLQRTARAPRGMFDVPLV